MPNQQLKWEWFEGVLLLDLFLKRSGRGVSKDTPEIQEVSLLLNSPTFRPPGAPSTYRNFNGIARQYGGFIHLDDSSRSGQQTSELFEDLWQTYRERPDEVAELARQIREIAAEPASYEQGQQALLRICPAVVSTAVAPQELSEIDRYVSPMTLVDLPTQRDLVRPCLEALLELGGSGHLREIFEAVVHKEGFSEEQVAESVTDGRSRILVRVGGALNKHLRHELGVTQNSKRGVWSLVPQVRHLTSADEILSSAPPPGGSIFEDDGDEEDEDVDWKAKLLARLSELSPDAFERLCLELLREAGLENLKRTGGSGDGGIDGVGVLRVSLVSFPIFFQAKRWKNKVGPPEVRDFRGAMSGRGEKGVLITTSSFSNAAREEARRDGSPPVNLIDGESLCDLLKDYGLGVGVTARTEEEVDITPNFFDKYEQPNP